MPPSLEIGCGRRRLMPGAAMGAARPGGPNPLPGSLSPFWARGAAVQVRIVGGRAFPLDMPQRHEPVVPRPPRCRLPSTSTERAASWDSRAPWERRSGCTRWPRRYAVGDPQNAAMAMRSLRGLGGSGNIDGVPSAVSLESAGGSLSWSGLDLRRYWGCERSLGVAIQWIHVMAPAPPSLDS